MISAGLGAMTKYPVRALRRLASLGYSQLLTRQVNRLSADARICVQGLSPRVYIRKGPGAQINLRGKLTIKPWLNGRTPVLIDCGAKSRLTIDGDFEIGGGTRLCLSGGAELYIGGRRDESGSGITECSTILVRRKVSIGTDFICGWNVFITDCDWHEIVGQPYQLDTIIGDHVWIASGVSVLKGTRVADGCVLACGTVAHKVTIPPNALVGGAPCRVLAEGRSWRRDLPALAERAAEQDPSLWWKQQTR